MANPKMISYTGSVTAKTVYFLMNKLDDDTWMDATAEAFLTSPADPKIVMAEKSLAAKATQVYQKQVNASANTMIDGWYKVYFYEMVGASKDTSADTIKTTAILYVSNNTLIRTAYSENIE